MDQRSAILPFRRRLTVRLDRSLRVSLDDIASQAGLMHGENRPKRAEICRVLLISSLLADKSVEDRVAGALYSGCVSDLSGLLGILLATLRPDVMSASEDLSGSGRLERYLVDKPRTVLSSPDINRVFLVLDDWLRGLLEIRASSEVKPLGMEDDKYVYERAADAKYIRDKIKDTFRDFDNHIPVIEGYLKAKSRLTRVLNEAVASQKTALQMALRKVG